MKRLKGEVQNKLFDELETFLEGTVEIKQGLKEPTRVTHHGFAGTEAVVSRKRRSRRIRRSVLNA